MKEIIKLCRELYRAHPTGGNLHIVLDDGNIANHHIIFCLEEAYKKEDWLCIGIGIKLLRLSYSDKRKLVNHYKDYAY